MGVKRVLVALVCSMSAMSAQALTTDGQAISFSQAPAVDLASGSASLSFTERVRGVSLDGAATAGQPLLIAANGKPADSISAPSLVAVPESSGHALLVAVLAAIGFVARRRRSG